MPEAYAGASTARACAYCGVGARAEWRASRSRRSACHRAREPWAPACRRAPAGPAQAWPQAARASSVGRPRRQRLAGLVDPAAGAGLRAQAAGLQQSIGVLVPGRVREVVAQHRRGRLGFARDAERHVGLDETIQRLLDMGGRLEVGDDHLVAIDGSRHSCCASGSSGRHPSRRLRACPRRCGCGSRPAWRRGCPDSASAGSSARRAPCLVAVWSRFGSLMSSKCAVAMMWWASAASLVPGCMRRVALGGGDRLLVLAGLVVGVGCHDDGAARLRRVGMVAVEILEFLAASEYEPLFSRLSACGVHLLRRIGIEKLWRRRCPRRSPRAGRQPTALRPSPHAEAWRSTLACPDARQYHSPCPYLVDRFSCRRTTSPLAGAIHRDLAQESHPHYPRT